MARLATFATALLGAFLVVSGCLAMKPTIHPLPAYSFDVNGNGLNDTNLDLRGCTTVPGSTCLAVLSSVTAQKEVLISSGQNVCSGQVLGRRVELIGDHVNDPLQEVGVLYCETTGQGSPPALAVVDLSSGQVVARAVAPSDQTNSFTEYPRDPQGNKYPFLAPSYGDGDPSQGRSVWGYLCLYKPDRQSDARCGPGFVAVPTKPQETFFREVGGYLQDLDADGWEDITLIFHKLVSSISPRAGVAIGTTEYDVAAATEPNAPKWFHDGRNYGIHSASTGIDGHLRTVMVGGMPVGGFENAACNVSWFAAVLESVPGQPATRHMSWSHYYGFSSTVFREVVPEFADDPAVEVARPGNYQNGCLHIFSDARSHMDREDVIMFNYFRQTAPVNSCLKEQYQLYLEPRWTPAKQRAWQACSATNLASSGTWNMQVLREQDGVLLAQSPNVYIWGASQELLPTGEMVYLVEVLPETQVPFDLRQHPPTPLHVRALINGQWSERGIFPVAGRPNLQAIPGSGSRGDGSYSYVAELTLEDLDGDGVKDLHMADGAWVGYSSTMERFTVKAP